MALIAAISSPNGIEHKELETRYKITLKSNLGVILESRCRANEMNADGLLPKIEFLALPLMNKLGKLGRITQS